MQRINYLILALFATTALTFTACNDDDDKIDCEDPANAELEECKEEEPPATTGLCIGQEDAYAAIEAEITDIATDVAIDDCDVMDYLTTPPTEEELKELQACVAAGIAAHEGVEINEECASCTAQVVGCAAAFCGLKCAGNTPEDCQACRDENGCDEGYTECQFGDEIVTPGPVACEEGQDPEEDNCIDCEDEANEDEDVCQPEVVEPVACEDGQDPEEDNCIDCEDEANEEDPACEE